MTDLEINKALYCVGKYAYPGTSWYVMRNGHICASGTKIECEAFITKNDTLDDNDTTCPTCGEDGGTKCGAVNCGY